MLEFSVVKIVVLYYFISFILPIPEEMVICRVDELQNRFPKSMTMPFDMNFEHEHYIYTWCIGVGVRCSSSFAQIEAKTKPPSPMNSAGL